MALASAWKMESARLARAPGVFFSNRRDLDLEVDRTQLSIEVDKTQLSLEVGDQLSFISAAPTQNFVIRMENASKLFNCELNIKTQDLRPA